MLHGRVIILLCLTLGGLVACKDAEQGAVAHKAVSAAPLAGTASVPASERVFNVEATVPPQCYTRSQGKFNPCYTCHQTHTDAKRPNFAVDGYLQANYDFSEFAFENHWKNLFVDRRPAIAAVSDESILQYINEDNYSPLMSTLQTRQHGGYAPDLHGLEEGARAFDEEGFARDGSGWRAFNYKPLPSTFWPTNGSMDDVVIRLPVAMRQDAAGKPDRQLYRINFAILEAAIKDDPHVLISKADARRLRAELHMRPDARLARPAHYLGAAADVAVTPFLYPAGTEFLHSVRYVGVGVGVDAAKGIVLPRRMKELRYMRKAAFLTPAQLNYRYGNERQEKLEEALPSFVSLGEAGMENGYGWVLQGFIEDRNGKLRAQTHEEQLFCMGCHSALGATIDQSFAFPRKLAGPKGWTYIDLRGMPDVPSQGQREGEILQYFKRVGGGDEFRENREVLTRFFKQDGSVDENKVRHADVHTLITPSKTRALALNKAYLAVVREQSFIHGRDAVLQPMRNVFDKVDPETAPTLPASRQYRGEIRLDWRAAAGLD